MCHDFEILKYDIVVEKSEILYACIIACIRTYFQIGKKTRGEKDKMKYRCDAGVRPR